MKGKLLEQLLGLLHRWSLIDVGVLHLSGEHANWSLLLFPGTP
jgi:hypothetical protein